MRSGCIAIIRQPTPTRIVPVEYIILTDEGHGFTKRKNQIESYGAILRFLERHLKGADEKPSGTVLPDEADEWLSARSK